MYHFAWNGHVVAGNIPSLLFNCFNNVYPYIGGFHFSFWAVAGD